MGILKNAIETVFADMGKDVKFLNTGSRVIETSAQAKYHDTLRAERGYTRGVHKARNNNNQEGCKPLHNSTLQLWQMKVQQITQ